MNAPRDPFAREAPPRMSRRKRRTIGAVVVLGAALVCWHGVRMGMIPPPSAGVPWWKYSISPQTGEFTLKFGKRWKGGLYPCVYFTGGSTEWYSDF